MSGLALACLGGGPAPSGLDRDLALLRLFDGPLRVELAGALERVLPEPITPDTDDVLDALSKRSGVDPDALGRVVRACRFLLREAARRSIPAEALSEDLDSLTGEDAASRELVLGLLGPAVRIVQREVLLDTIADHGNVLTGVEWRVDTLGRSSRGATGGVAVAWLTLRYQEGESERRLSLQVVPGVLDELRAACDAMKR